MSCWHTGFAFNSDINMYRKSMGYTYEEFHVLLYGVYDSSLALFTSYLPGTAMMCMQNNYQVPGMR